MRLDHRHKLLRGSRHFEKLTFEFLFVSLAKNLAYIFLVLQLLSIFGVINFELDPDHFPNLTLKGELRKFQQMGFNPVSIYLHFIGIFFAVVKAVTLTFVDHIIESPFTAGIVAILLVNMFLLYRGMSHGSARESWKKRSIFKFMFTDILKKGNLLEDALFMMFVIDAIIFITIPEKSHIYFLMALYAVMLSIKITPAISNFIADVLNGFESSFFHNNKVVFVVVLLDIAAVYFDSRSMFTLFLMIIAYTAIATGILSLTKKHKVLNEILYYPLYFGLLVFYFSTFAILAVSIAFVAVVQLPVLLYYGIKKKKLAPAWLMQSINAALLLILLIIAF